MKPFPQGWTFRPTLIAALAIFMSGCASTTTVVKPDVKLESYRKVYVPKPSDDPRKIFPKVVDRLKKAGFTVVELDPDGPAVDSQGTGFLVSSNGHVLTCAHVVSGQTNATLWIQKKRFTGVVVACDTNIDLAVVRIDNLPADLPPLRFGAETNCTLGQDIYTMGFPLADVLGTSARINRGLVSSTVGFEDNPSQLQISAEVQPGNSGGPLLNDKGNVVGVVSSTLNALRVLMQTGGNLPQNVNFAINAAKTRDFLEKSNVPYFVQTTPPDSKDFETASRSLALIRSGDVSDEDLKQPAVVFACTYISMWDMYYRFRAIQFDFYDTRKGDRVFRVGVYRDTLASEDGSLNHLFADVHKNFFPGQPNPFGTKESPKPAKGATK